MRNPVLIYTLPDGKQLWLADPDPIVPVNVPPVPMSLGPHLLFNTSIFETPISLKQATPERTRTAPLTVQANTTVWGATVIQDAGKFRIWYMGQDSAGIINATATSTDGVTWGASTPLSYYNGRPLVGILDEGASFAAPARRYKFVTRTDTSGPRWPAEIRWSADGVNWTLGSTTPITTNAYGETWVPYREGSNLCLLHRWNQTGFTWKDSDGVTHTNTAKSPFVRTFALTSSSDSLHFPPSTAVFVPCNLDDGETQFYGVSNVLHRGEFRIATLSIYREDLIAPEVPAGSFGTGYTTLAWSLDGVHWNRFYGTDPHYFDPHTNKDAWDHAIAWITSLVPVGDEVYLYYSGFQFGHLNRTDRQLGLLKIKRDRFVSAHGTTVLKTKPLSINASTLTLNMMGQIRMRITDTNGVPLAGFDYANSQVLNGDFLNAPYNLSLRSLLGKTVRLEFELTNADLFAFYLS
jgi:hypothetical protein